MNPRQEPSPFTRPRVLDRPALRLVVFHHAGGSAAAYYPLTRAVPPDWELLLLDLPGRGKRHSQPQLERLGDMAAQAADDILPWASDDIPLALFGHSLGAVLAAEAARLLERRGVEPFWVGVSGSACPQRRAQAPIPDHELSDRELMAELAGMGGMHRRIDELPQLRARFLQLVRSDLRALSRYRPDPLRARLAAPLTAFGAIDDPWAPPHAVAGWARETATRFRHRTFAGGHFFLLGAGFGAFAAQLVQDVQCCLGAQTDLRSTEAIFARTPA
jgi:surfactin synthase thioesterase subunit